MTCPPLQPFAWGALPLFGENLKLPEEVLSTGILKLEGLYTILDHGPFDDETILDAIPDIIDKKETLPKTKVRAQRHHFLKY